MAKKKNQKKQQEQKQEPPEVVEPQEEQPAQINKVDDENERTTTEPETATSQPFETSNGSTEVGKSNGISDNEKDKEIEDLKEQLKLKSEESDKYQSNYQALLSRLSSMKTVFHKMKEAESELEIVKQESLNKDIQVNTLTTEITNLNSECDRLMKENHELKNGFKSKESDLEDDLRHYESINKKLTNELKSLKNEREEYVIMANEEQKLKLNMSHELNELNLRLSNMTLENDDHKLKSKELTKDIDNLNNKIAELHRTHESEKNELSLQIENKVSEIVDLQSQIIDLNKTIDENALKLVKLSSLENDMKQKQLLIGKLRHENIVLNEHLTKAMKLIKKESSSETVDRELISNLFISFLQIPRADTKKFEVLSLISNFLNWDDEKKRHAGLISANTSKARSSSILNVPHLTEQRSHSTSFVSLWTEFLEKESTPNTPSSPITESFNK